MLRACRATVGPRAITQHFEAIGALRCERVWDKTTRSYIPNIIWVQTLFFTLIGYEYGKFESAQKQQLAWENLKLKEKNEAPVSIEEARKRAREKHIEIAMVIRAKERAIKKEKKEKRKLLQEISLMNEPEAKYHIQKLIVSQYDKDQLVETGWVELKNRINKTYHFIKKQAHAQAQPPPNG